MLAKVLRARSSAFTKQAVIASTVRGGGGGHFDRPDPAVQKPYQHTRLIHLEDINTILYHDFAPEYHLHLHSPHLQSTKQGLAHVFLYLLFIVVPAWGFISYLNWNTAAVLKPSVRPGKDHAHMIPRVIDHLKRNNYEDKQDALGRRTAQFYKNACYQNMTIEFKPTLVQRIESHGFKF